MDQMVQTGNANRRRASRSEYHTAGTIKSVLRNTELPCVVEDLSKTGARLQVENVNHIPDTFHLGITGSNFSAECIVVWRSRSEVGVIFETAPVY